MDFLFFTENNKSGYKTREKWLKDNHPKLYTEIINHSDGLDIPFKEKIIFFYSNINERPKCKNCGQEVKFRNRLDKPYGEFCNIECFNGNKDEMINRIKKTNNLKYGVDFYPQDSDFIKKVKNTKKEKYGNENYTNPDKVKKTKKEKYGDENYNNIEKCKKTNTIRYGVDNYSLSNSFKEKIIDNYKSIYSDYNILNVNNSFIDVKCDDCNVVSTIHKQMVYERHKVGHKICLTCNPIGQTNSSQSENEIYEFIKEYSNKVEQRKKIDGIEIDIIINDRIGIEFNGLWWHNELHKSNDFHLKKTIKCAQNDIELIHIFEDEWKYKRDIVKSILLNRLGLTPKKLFARKCELKYVSSKESEIFLEKNHIQGKVKSSVRIGAFYNNEMVSLMTFSKGRVLMGGKNTEWELNRFCNEINLNVVGIFSKMLNKFIKELKPTVLISYSDIRLFKGGLYEKNNFTRKTQSNPNYWYVNGDTRRHRFHYRKSRLIKEGYDGDKTEREIMFDRKIYRIYDCGNIRWEINLQ